MFQSQTGSPSSSDSRHREWIGRKGQVSIPNGKPILFRLRMWDSYQEVSQCQVSIPNGKPILFRQSRREREKIMKILFQSQTGSPSSSDGESSLRQDSLKQGFNPKREAHPLQTLISILPRWILQGFNPKREAHPLQTQAVTHNMSGMPVVSIPNGKPILFRQSAYPVLPA